MILILTFTGAGPCAALPRVPLMLAPAWGPRSPKPPTALDGRVPLRGSAARPAYARAGLGARSPKPPTALDGRVPLRGSAARARLCSRPLGAP